MDPRRRWVLLAYRLPREPSTPRIGVWRQLRRLGVAQLGDGVVAVPLDARTREQLEWLAQEIFDHGGEATVWLAEPALAADQRAMAATLAAAVAVDYERVIQAAVADVGAALAIRRRTASRLRREMRRIAARDYFPGPVRDRARDAIEALASSTRPDEAAS